MKKLALFLCAIMIFSATPVLDYTMPAQQNAPILAQAKAKVKLNKTKATLVVNRTVKLKVKGTKKKVKWTTSNKKVATVSKKGVVTAKKPGKATITAKVGKKKYKCKITVIAGYNVSGIWYSEIKGTKLFLDISAYSNPTDAAGVVYIHKDSPESKYIYSGEYYEVAPNEYVFKVAGASVNFKCEGTTLKITNASGAIFKDFIGFKFMQYKAVNGN